MKPTSLIAALGIFTLSIFTSPSFAQANDKNGALDRMSYRALQLERELNELQSEIKQLKQDKEGPKKQTRKEKRVQKVTKRHVKRQKALKGKGVKEPVYYPHTVFKFGGIAVITSPYIGIRSEFDGADLIVNISSINEDLRLLEQMQILANALKAHDAPPLTYPLIELSGKVEALTTVNKPYSGATRGDVDLGSVELGVLAYLNTWALGFMSLDYDSAPPTSGPTVQRTANSRVFLNKGFVTLGNLNKFPMYTTWGQYFVPFGRYSSNMLSSPLTLVMARTKARSILLGYRQPGDNAFFASAYGFRGDARTSSHWQGGANLGYTFHTHDVSGEIALSTIASMADSNGMQANGGGLPSFAGFGANSTTERLSKRVPGIDINGKLGYGNWYFIAEYLSAARRFSNSDLLFNGRGALPSALNVEASYRFLVWNKPMSVAFGYGHTREAFALNLPEHRYIAAINASLIRDTIETLEVRHDVNYRTGTTAGGRTGSNTTSSVAPTSTNGLGKSSTMVTAQVGLYF